MLSTMSRVRQAHESCARSHLGAPADLGDRLAERLLGETARAQALLAEPRVLSQAQEQVLHGHKLVAHLVPGKDEETRPLVSWQQLQPRALDCCTVRLTSA